MGTSYDRATVIMKAFAERGIRATTDPSAANPPVVLMVPPERRYDVGCGYTARWSLVGLAPGATGADRSTWLELDRLADACAEVVDVVDCQLVAYTLNGVTYVAYLITAEEAI